MSVLQVKSVLLHFLLQVHCVEGTTSGYSCSSTVTNAFCNMLTTLGASVQPSNDQPSSSTLLLSVLSSIRHLVTNSGLLDGVGNFGLACGKAADEGRVRLYCSKSGDLCKRCVPAHEQLQWCMEINSTCCMKYASLTCMHKTSGSMTVTQRR